MNEIAEIAEVENTEIELTADEAVLVAIAEMNGEQVETETETEDNEQPTFMNAEEIRRFRTEYGISRTALQALTGLNSYRCWAVEQADKQEQADVQEWQCIVTEAFKTVEQMGLPSHLQSKKSSKYAGVSKAALIKKLAEINDLLQTARTTKVRRDCNDLIDLAIDVINDVETKPAVEQPEAIDDIQITEAVDTEA